MKLTLFLLLVGSALVIATILAEENKSMNSSNEVAVIKTSEGEMVVQFWTDAAPNTIENFKKLARAPDFTTGLFFTASSKDS